MTAACEPPGSSRAQHSCPPPGTASGTTPESRCLESLAGGLVQAPPVIRAGPERPDLTTSSLPAGIAKRPVSNNFTQRMAKHSYLCECPWVQLDPGSATHTIFPSTRPVTAIRSNFMFTAAKELGLDCLCHRIKTLMELLRQDERKLTPQIPQNRDGNAPSEILCPEKPDDDRRQFNNDPTVSRSGLVSRSSSSFVYSAAGLDSVLRWVIFPRPIPFMANLSPQWREYCSRVQPLCPAWSSPR